VTIRPGDRVTIRVRRMRSPDIWGCGVVTQVDSGHHPVDFGFRVKLDDGRRLYVRYDQVEVWSPGDEGRA
jgi:hypothetical protein